MTPNDVDDDVDSRHNENGPQNYPKMQKFTKAHKKKLFPLSIKASRKGLAIDDLNFCGRKTLNSVERPWPNQRCHIIKDCFKIGIFMTKKGSADDDKLGEGWGVGDGRTQD
ncbi:hypothetical protein Tcan_10443 [Toxocara canis]|uniref:Uncharacterized protein n=1 Tax=Toxocara canis TaxID=6265 RepID=A0A0B2UVY0_TOXCA|nr:hypothetical protein Tcan_10443 [Toxocara canis]